MIEQRIYRHRGYTLIDITKTDVTKFTPELERMRNKQRNWETVVQILGLRTQIMSINQLKTETKDLSQHVNLVAIIKINNVYGHLNLK
jgi:hypothetical protein